MEENPHLKFEIPSEINEPETKTAAISADEMAER
jgi:hypothetical protein